MRWSETFIPTLRNDPADAEAASHKLMVRAGLIRQLGAGIYSYLPIGWRVARKAEAIVREEMDAIGAQEFYLPALHPAEVWKESGRWDAIGGEMFRLKDRKDAEMCLGMTCEEIFTFLARDGLNSYKQLPQIWYQIQCKFRDEPRPKSGVLRGRQFTMKDSYSFDKDWAGLDASFDKHAVAYKKIFDRCGIDSIPVEASSGAMGGSESVEFMARSTAGEDWIARCTGCDYSANVERAVSAVAPIVDEADDAAVEKFPTPGIRTIADLVTFEGGAAADRQIKTLVFMKRTEEGESPVLLLIQGDDELNEVGAIDAVGAGLRPAHEEEIVKALGAKPGSLGAVGVKDIPIYADKRLKGRVGMTTGANHDDHHVRHVSLERDIAVTEWADLRLVRDGEPCTKCGKALELQKAIEIGHIFKLGLRYSESMKASVIDENGKLQPVVMGSYGIGIDRIVAAAIEAHHDDKGIRWPLSLAPYKVVVAPIKLNDDAQREASEKLYAELKALGIEVIYDDRNERPGAKFKDHELVGIPFRVVTGRGLADGQVELYDRYADEKKDVPLAEVIDLLKERLA
ncbi:MAG: proline--tRNA ligase [Deltaproteobacteria bacterium]